MDRAPDERFFFCRQTQLSYLRLLTLSACMKEYVCTNAEAIHAYRTLLTDHRIGYLEEEPSNLEMQWLALQRVPRVAKMMDGFLLGSLCAHGQLIIRDI
jgi:hypothetical protein